MQDPIDPDATSPSHSDSVQFYDALQWLIETRAAGKQNGDVARTAGEVMRIWYGSVHTLSTGLSFALLDLYSRNEAQYVEPLRAQLTAYPLRGSQVTRMTCRC